MARKYVNPHRADYEHEPRTGEHTHMIGGQPLLHSHQGDADHTRIAAAMAGSVPPRHVRFAGGGMQILASARGGPYSLPQLPVAAAPDAEPPPGAVLDKEPFAKNLLTFLAAIRDDVNARQRISAAWTEEVPSDGGFLLSENLRSSITAYLTRATVYPRAMVLPMSTYRLGLPAVDNADQSDGAQPLGGIQWSVVAEGEAIPATPGGFSRSALTAWKLAALLAEVPAELLDDAAPAMSDLLGRVIGEGYSWVVDDYAINGTGVGEPQGLLSAGCAYGVARNTSDAVLHTDVVNLMGQLHPASKAAAVWLASDDVFESLLNLYELVGAGTDGVVPPPQSLKFDAQLGCWTLLGVPFFPGDHQPALGTAGDLLLADLSWLAIGERQAMTVELSRQGRGFTSNTVDVKVRGRLDMRYLVPQVITLPNGVQRSPVVVLDDAA